MATDENKSGIEIPDAPAILPKSEQEKWKKNFSDAHDEAQDNFPGDPIAQRQHAHREANRALKTPKLTSAEQALQLPAWQFLHREIVNGVLKIVTIDGKKYSFKVGKSDAQKNGAGGEKPAA